MGEQGWSSWQTYSSYSPMECLWRPGGWNAPQSVVALISQGVSSRLCVSPGSWGGAPVYHVGICSCQPSSWGMADAVRESWFYTQRRFQGELRMLEGLPVICQFLFCKFQDAGPHTACLSVIIQPNKSLIFDLCGCRPLQPELHEDISQHISVRRFSKCYPWNHLYPIVNDV